ncbi:hypothetical protein [Pedobacter sp. L105]|uniref:hypothetical protein n=1 Tax=Pedobacter sp. L105 TaxID=1641871 RepID=UPI00131DB6F3|nr:hypothetical protein [Pedobacter sp. L105]
MIRKLLLMLCFGIVSVTLLYIYSNKSANKKNGFNRSISKKTAILENTILLDNDLYSIADIDPKFITLYKFRKPYDLLKVTIDLAHRQYYQLPLRSKNEQFPGLNTVAFIKDSTIVLSGGTSTAYQLTSGYSVTKRKKLDSLVFNQSEVVNSDSFILMSEVQLGGTKRRKIKKLNFRGNELNYYIPEKQIDGYFCTDGLFKYDSKSRKLVYMFYYRGSFVCLNSNLKVLYKAKTIDTITLAKIQLKISDSSITQSTPPPIVNKRFCIADNSVYIQSALKADNEPSSNPNHGAIIDIYNLQSGKYKSSFYLPYLERQKLTEFRIYEHSLIALYANKLAVFKIPDF